MFSALKKLVGSEPGQLRDRRRQRMYHLGVTMATHIHIHSDRNAKHQGITGYHAHVYLHIHLHRHINIPSHMHTIKHTPTKYTHI